MQKKGFCLLAFFLICTICLNGCAQATVFGKKTVLPATHCLVLGIDNVGVNTDVVLLVRYEPEPGVVTVMQLPRDTYFEQNDHAIRLNHVYASYLIAGATKKEALQKTATTVGEALDIDINSAVALDLQVFSDVVDAIGGVPITIPFNMEYRDEEQNLTISLPAGEMILDGKQAGQFVRFRASYIEGDIGRLDAQKVFMAAFFKKVASDVKLMDVCISFLKNRRDMTLFLDISRAIQYLLYGIKNRENIQVQFLSAPGEAVYMDGLGWRYALNQEAMSLVLQQYFGRRNTEKKFDVPGIFCAENDDAFVNIYFADAYPIEIYTPENIGDIKIQKKE